MEEEEKDRREVYVFVVVVYCLASEVRKVADDYRRLKQLLYFRTYN